jgi:hypothetical protein
VERSDRPDLRGLTLDTLRRNAILAELNTANAFALLKSAELVELKARAQIYEVDRPIEHVYFPIDAVLSVVTQLREGAIEMATIGREGVSAIPLLLGATESANQSYCQVPGSAVVMSSDVFRDLLDSGDVEFRTTLNRFLQAYINMLGQLAACNGIHSIYERSARWLLMTRDRVDSDEIALSEEYLSMMLGPARPGGGAPIAATSFERAGFIHYAPEGPITILDRKGLEAVVCECYAVARAQFGWFASNDAMPRFRHANGNGVAASAGDTHSDSASET